MGKNDLVRFVANMDSIKRIGSGKVENLVDDQHVYDMVYDDNSSMGIGAYTNIGPEALLENIGLHRGDNISIHSKTRRLGNVKHNSAPVAHSDKRRTIYDPKKIMKGFGSGWVAHNIIRLSEPGLMLGNHHHPYREAFFTPEGILAYSLVDPEEPNNPLNYMLNSGGDNRLLIPKGIAHMVIGTPGSVIMGFGVGEFDASKLIGSDKEVLETFSKVASTVEYPFGVVERLSKRKK